MKTINDKYKKNICYYLDTIFKSNKDIRSVFDYDSNPNKNFIEYIKNASGNVNYEFSYPMSVFWNLTSACNFRCLHCIYNDTEYSSKNDLTPEQALLLTDELIELGVTYVVLSGGEIFMRSDLMNIIKKLKSNNIAIRLLTNAALINDEIIDELSCLFNPYTDSISVSLDGATGSTFEKIRQTKIFDKIITNIRKMTEKNIRVTAVCTVNSINYAEVVDIYKLAQNIGVYNFIVGKTISYNSLHDSLLVSEEDLFELYYRLSLARSDKTKLEINFWSTVELLNIPEVLDIVEASYYQKYIKNNYTQILPRNCQCHDRLAIDSDGAIYLCLEAIMHGVAPLGNYKLNSIKEIWEKRKDNVLFKQRKIEDMVCTSCKYNVFCNSGCVVKAYISNKDCDSPQIPCCVSLNQS